MTHTFRLLGCSSLIVTLNFPTRKKNDKRNCVIVPARAHARAHAHAHTHACLSVIVRTVFESISRPFTVT